MNVAVTQHMRQLNSSGQLNGISKLPEHWDVVIRCEGAYSEGF